MRIDENYWALLARYWLYRRWRWRRGRGARSVLRFRKRLAELPRGSLMIDCGANVGDVTSLFLAAGHRVIAFEPEPVAFERLQSRCGHDPNATLIPKAVGAVAGTARIYRTDGAMAGDVGQTIASSLIRTGHASRDSGIDVEVVDLCDFIRRLSEVPSILKLDIEGAEAEILPVLLRQPYLKDIDMVLVETHERFSPAIADKIRTARKAIRRARLKNVDLDWV